MFDILKEIARGAPNFFVMVIALCFLVGLWESTLQATYSRENLRDAEGNFGAVIKNILELLFVIGARVFEIVVLAPLTVFVIFIIIAKLRLI
jgi:hypothetical protein